MRHYGSRGQRRMEDVSVFVQSFAPPPQMYVFGAIDFAGAVAKIGKFMGYRVTVCDARPVFATRERFPTADEVVVSWPDDFLQTAEVDGRTAICVLTHDPKFDVPVLKAALDTDADVQALTGDAAVGVDIVRKALKQPLRWIAQNAGEDGYVVVSKVAELEPNHGFNAKTGVYGDLIADGVIDPVKVTRSALANAASIAALVLTTETLVADKPAEEDEADHQH